MIILLNRTTNEKKKFLISLHNYADCEMFFILIFFYFRLASKKQAFRFNCIVLNWKNKVYHNRLKCRSSFFSFIVSRFVSIGSEMFKLFVSMTESADHFIMPKTRRNKKIALTTKNRSFAIFSVRCHRLDFTISLIVVVNRGVHV